MESFVEVPVEMASSKVATEVSNGPVKKVRIQPGEVLTVA